MLKLALFELSAFCPSPSPSPPLPPLRWLPCCIPALHVHPAVLPAKCDKCDYKAGGRGAAGWGQVGGDAGWGQVGGKAGWGQGLMYTSLWFGSACYCLSCMAVVCTCNLCTLLEHSVRIPSISTASSSSLPHLFLISSSSLLFLISSLPLQLKVNLEICLNLPREAIALLRSALPLPECGHAATLAEGFDGEVMIESNMGQHKPFHFSSELCSQS